MTGSPDGSTAVVVLTAAVHPPVVNFLVPDGIRIEASSTARARLTRLAGTGHGRCGNNGHVRRAG